MSGAVMACLRGSDWSVAALIPATPESGKDCQKLSDILFQKN
jgi:hypothetical protein